MTIDIRLERLGDLIVRYPGWTRTLEEFGIDGRTGTEITLGAAADRAGVELDALMVAFSGADRGVSPCVDLDRVSIRGLIDHIERVHHRFLRREFPRIAQLIDVSHQADPGDERLARVAEVFTELRGDLEPHIESEEATLFPMCHDIVDAFSWPSFHTGPIGDPISRLRHDHDHAGALLDDLAALAADVGSIDDELISAIGALESDLRQHLVEENERLFPLVLSLWAEINEPWGPR